MSKKTYMVPALTGVIARAEMGKRDVPYGEDALILGMADGREILVFDARQCCCEHRYTHCDENLHQYVGRELLGLLTVAELPTVDDAEVHESQQVEVHTSVGPLCIVTHNEHDGYYGGFDVAVECGAEVVMEWDMVEAARAAGGEHEDE